MSVSPYLLIETNARRVSERCFEESDEANRVTLQVTDEPLTIYTPGADVPPDIYPSTVLYPLLTECFWELVSSDGRPMRIEISNANLEERDLDDPEDPCFDFLELRNGESHEAR